MSRRLGLAAYRAMSWRLPESGPQTAGKRGKGQLLWAHAATPARYLALCDVTARVRSQRPDLEILLTVDGNLPEVPPDAALPQPVHLPSDHPNSVRAFLNHWRPDLCLWTGGGLRPNLIAEAAQLDLPLILADLDETDLPVRPLRWMPDVSRACLSCFGTIMASNTATAAQLRRLGVLEDTITIASRLRTGASPPSCPDTMLSSTTEDLAGRLVWLAAPVTMHEAETILQAHREALKLLHRLLLIVIPTGPEDYIEVSRLLADTGLRHEDWSMGDEIDETTQVLISCTPDTLGLWYRVAPLTLMASSLSEGASGRNPLDAAALGSAVLYGPHVANHSDAYARLTSEGAARLVHNADTLAQAVVQLVAPDEAAAMALAGWQVVTESADLTDRLIDMIHEGLDLRETADARA